MSRRILLSFYALIITLPGMSQGFEKVYEHTQKEPLISLTEQEEAEYFLSAEGKYLISNTSESFKIVSGTTGEELAGGEHIRKDNKTAKIASLFVSDNSRGQLIEDVSFNEGSGFYAFDAENVVVFLDWNLNSNIIKAYDTETGKKVWETDQYRFSPGKNKQLAAVLATMAAGSIASQTFSLPALIAAGSFRSVKNQQTTNYGSHTARAFITPLEETGSFLLKAGDRHVCLDLLSGNEKWVYDGYPVNIADHRMVPGKDEVFLVNFNPSYWKKSENLIIKLDTQTGEEKYRIENLSNYAQGRTYMEGDRLILDYYGAEVFDVPTGERVLLSIDEKIVKANETMMDILGNNGERMTEAFANPSWVDDGIMYTATEHRGGKTYPVMGAGNKPQFTAYDLQTSRKLWTTDVQQRGSLLIGLTDKGLILRAPKGFGKAYLVAVDKTDGKIINETEKVKQYLFRDGAGELIGEEKILFSGKYGVLIFDAESLEQEGMLDIKAANVGKTQATGLMPDGFFIVADRGVGFYDQEGNFLNSLKLKKVESALWTGETLIVLGKSSVTAVDLVQQKKSGELPVTDTMLASNNLKHWLFFDGKTAEKYSLLVVPN